MKLHKMAFAIPLLAAGIVARAATFTDHGTAAAVSEARGLTVTTSADGAPLILALPMDRYAGGLRTSILVIDARAGRATQHWHPRKDASNEPPYHLLLASSGKLYVMFGPRFLEFDIASRAFTFTGSAGDAGDAGTAMSMAEAPDGKVYAATYPTAHLLAFGELRRRLHQRRRRLVVGAERPAGDRRRHRHQRPAEQQALHLEQRQDAGDLAAAPGEEVARAMVQVLLDGAAPARQVEGRVPRLPASEGLPLRLLRAHQRRHRRRHGAGRCRCGRSLREPRHRDGPQRLGGHSASTSRTVVKRNSRNSAASRPAQPSRLR